MSEFSNLQKLSPFQRVGELLKSARKSQNLSLQDIVEQTRINQNILTQIEEGRVEEHPGPVFLKGFLRSYAKVVGCDPEEIVKKADLGNEVKDKEKTLYINELPDMPSKSKKFSIWKVFIILFILGGVIYSGFIFFINTEKGQTQGQEESQVKQPVVKPVKQPVVKPMVSDLSNQETVSETPNLLDENVNLGHQTYSFVIESRKTVWIRIQIDENLPFETKMFPGQQLNIQSQQGIKITAGESSAIRVFFDGESVFYQGEHDLIIDWEIAHQ